MKRLLALLLALLLMLTLLVACSPEDTPDDTIPSGGNNDDLDLPQGSDNAAPDLDWDLT